MNLQWTMNPQTMNTSSARSTIGRTALIALACAFSLAIAQSPMAKAGDTAALRPLDDKAPSLPLTASFEKGSDPSVGPYILNLKNVSNDSIKVSVKILLSVTFHANTKDRNITDHVIDPGQVWAITYLAAADKVTIPAEGFAPLHGLVAYYRATSVKPLLGRLEHLEGHRLLVEAAPSRTAVVERPGLSLISAHAMGGSAS